MAGDDTPPDVNPEALPRKAALAWGAWALRWRGGDTNAITNAILDRTGVQANDWVRLFSAWAVHWGLCGFPAVSLTHKLAASLMATSMPADLVPELEMPWPCLVVDVPAGLLPDDALQYTGLGEGGERHTTVDSRIVAVVLAEMEQMPAYSHERYVLGVIAQPGGIVCSWGMADLSLLPVADQSQLGDTPPQLRVLRELLGRLVVGALVELDAPAHKRARDEGPPAVKTEGKGTHRKPPSAWTFELRRDVRVDARQWVKDYVAGGGKSPAVRVLVRGHHKRQVCGVGRTNRKWIHVEPYWRGDDALPIAVRAHKLVEQPKEDET